MRPFLSMAMMVKNEEALLDDALKSVAGWVDELIVVDTGSTDRTVEIATAHGATVSYFEWCDSFAAARNETLRCAGGEWILVLDADERLRGDDPALFRATLKAGEQHPFEAYLLNVVNVDRFGRPQSSGFGPRIFPNDRRVGYAGRVHNRFMSLDPGHPAIAGTYIEGVEIEHLGYDAEIYRTRQKSERSLPLILRSVEDDPEDAEMRFYLGREYLRLADPEQAAAALEEAVVKMLSKAESQNLLQAALYNLIDASRLAKRPLQQTMGFVTEGLKLFPKNPDIWNAAAAVLLEYGKPEEAIRCLEQATANLTNEWSDLDRSQGLALRAWTLHERMGLACAEAGRYEQAYRAFLLAIGTRPADAPGWGPVIDTICVLAEKLGDHGRIPEIRAKMPANAP